MKFLVMAQIRKSKKRELIVQEASKLFLSMGYAAVLVEDIADRACVSKKTLYNHFESKKELLKVCIDNFVSNYEKGAQLVLARPYNTALGQLEAYLQFIGKSFGPAYLRLWTELRLELPEVWSEMIQQRQKVLIGHLSNVIGRAIASGQVKDNGLAEMAIVIYISSMEQMNDQDYMLRFPDEIRLALPLDIATRASQVLTLLFQGLLKPVADR